MTARPAGDPAGSETVCFAHAVARPLDGKLPPTAIGRSLCGPDPLTTVASGDLFAVVSRVPASDFGADGLDARLEDLDWLRETGLAHHRVLLGLVGRCTFVPLKFCTLFSAPARIETTLSRHAGALNRALDRVADAVELGVKAQAKPGRLMDWIWHHADALAPTRQAASRVSEGRAHFVRKAAEAQADAAARSFVDACAAASHDRLAGCAREAVFLGGSGQAAGRGLGFGGAYLVADAATDDFRAAVQALQTEHAPHGLAFTLTGPWPPYSFADVVIEEPADAA